MRVMNLRTTLVNVMVSHTLSFTINMLLIFESAKVLPGNLRAPDNQQVVLWGARVDQMFNPNYNVIEVVLRFLGRCGRYTIR
jgi:hypothetical protein